MSNVTMVVSNQPTFLDNSKFEEHKEIIIKENFNQGFFERLPSKNSSCNFLDQIDLRKKKK